MLEGVQMGTVYPSSETTQKIERQGSQDKSVKDVKKVKTGERVMGQALPGEKAISEEQLIHAIDKANKSFEPFDRRFELSVHEKTKAVMVKVIDSTNDEVIREIPSEKVLDMVAHMLEVAGIIVDKKI